MSEERTVYVKNEPKVEVFDTSPLLFYAHEYIESSIEDKEIKMNNMTEIFFDELFNIVENKEVINMNINGQPATGKSTVGFAIGSVVLKQCYGKTFSMWNVARDQSEFMERMKDPELKDTVIVQDEQNMLEGTGENSTIEQSAYDTFSDVHAQRNIHKIACSPKESPDKNANILLEVLQADKKRYVTHCYLYYKVFKGGIEYVQLLGHVNINVKEIVEAGWYQTYRKKKFEKMEMLTREGIFRPRELHYAPLKKSVIEELRPMVRITTLTREDIRPYVIKAEREHKIATSMIGRAGMIDEIKGHLNAWKVYWKITNKINETERSYKKGKIDVLAREVKMASLNKLQDTARAAIKSLEEELDNQIRLKAQYDKMEDEER